MGLVAPAAIPEGKGRKEKKKTPSAVTSIGKEDQGEPLG